MKSPYESTAAAFAVNPPVGMVNLRRTTSHFRRSRNGAWLGNGADESFFQIPIAEVVGWTNPGLCSFVTLKFDDGTTLSIDGANTPVRAYGFGRYGTITLADGREQRISEPNPKLPTLALCYEGTRTFTLAELATFVPFDFSK